MFFKIYETGVSCLQSPANGYTDNLIPYSSIVYIIAECVPESKQLTHMVRVSDTVTAHTWQDTFKQRGFHNFLTQNL